MRHRRWSILIALSLAGAFSAVAQPQIARLPPPPPPEPASEADIRVDVNLVEVTVSVLDRDGVPVPGLELADFELRDNGEVRELSSVWQETDLPLTVGLVVDISGSQQEFWDRHRNAAGQFLRQVLQPGDQAFLVSVGGSGVRLITDLTSDVEELEEGVAALGNRRRGRIGIPFGDPCPQRQIPDRYIPILQTRPGDCRGTPLWNGVFAAARLRMREVEGRKAIIVLSDGKDTGSPHGLNDAIESSQSANTPVYSIVSNSFTDRIFGPILGGLGNRMNGRFGGSRELGRLSEETGGRRFQGSDDGSADVFAQIEQELRSLYVLAFTPPSEARDGMFHELEVKTTAPQAEVRARRGYLALAGSGN